MHDNDLCDSVKNACLRKSGPGVKCKNALGQSDCRIFKL